MGQFFAAMQSAGMLMGSLISCIVTLPFIIIALAFFYAWRRNQSKAQASYKWNSVTGTIGAASVESRNSSGSGGGYNTYYYPALLYEYDAEGQHLVGQNITFGSQVGYGNPAQAQAVLARYPVGSRVPVYYNPANPSEAVLEHSAGTASNVFLYIALLMLFILCVTTVPIMLVMGGMNALFASFPFTVH